MTTLEIIGLVIAALAGAFTALARIYKFGPFVDKTDNEILPVPLPIQPEPEPIAEPVTPKYLWDTPANVRHSVRVICDEEMLTLEQKNTMTATIGGESGYNTKAINKNYVIRGGVKTLSSTDYGLCQWNDYWHGKEITPDESMNNPEKAVRLMCAYWKRGQRDTWIAYKNGSYKAYL